MSSDYNLFLVADLSNMWTMHWTSQCILYTGTRITLTVLECHFGSLPVSNILVLLQLYAVNFVNVILF